MSKYDGIKLALSFFFWFCHFYFLSVDQYLSVDAKWTLTLLVFWSFLGICYIPTCN